MHPSQMAITMDWGLFSNASGKKLWGELGPFRGMSELHALLWGTQVGLLAVLSLDFHKALVETDNREAYDTIRVQEFIILPPDLEEAFSHFNTLFANQFQKTSKKGKFPSSHWSSIAQLGTWRLMA